MKARFSSLLFAAVISVLLGGCGYNQFQSLDEQT